MWPTLNYFLPYLSIFYKSNHFVVCEVINCPLTLYFTNTGMLNKLYNIHNNPDMAIEAGNVMFCYEEMCTQN